MKAGCWIGVLVLLVLPVGGHPESGTGIDDLQVVRISQQDRAAVLESPGHGFLLIREGERVEGLGQVAEISAGRVVVNAAAGQKLIFRVDRTGQRLERIDSVRAGKPHRHWRKHAPVRGEAP